MEQAAVVERKSKLAQWLSLAALAVISVLAAGRNVVDLDIWHQMALFREVLRLGYVPMADTFAFTPTLPRAVHHEWGAGALAYAITQALGLNGLLVLKYFFLALVLFLCYRCVQEQAQRPNPYLFMLGASLLGTGFAPVRAQAYTYCFIAALLWFLERDRHGLRFPALAWAMASVVWCNLHGGYLMGVAILTWECGERLVRREPCRHLCFALAGMLGAGFVNPYGIYYFAYLVRAYAMPRPDIQEWSSLWTLAASLPSARAASVEYLASIIVVLFCVGRGQVKSLRRIGLVTLLGVMGIMHYKAIPLYGTVWLCCVPPWVASLRVPGFLSRKHLPPTISLIAICSGAIMIGLLGYSLSVPAAPRFPSDLYYPVGALKYLQSAKFSGNLITPFNYGSYVSWEMYPAVRVSLDSRYEAVYSERIMREHNAFLCAERGWESFLRSYPADAALIPTRAPVAKLIGSLGWREVYRDGEFLLFVPGTAQCQKLRPAAIAR